MNNHEEDTARASTEGAEASGAHDQTVHNCGADCNHEHGAEASGVSEAKAPEASQAEDHCAHSCGCGGCGESEVDPAVAARNELLSRTNTLARWALELLQNKQIAAARRATSAAWAFYDIAGGGDCEEAVWIYTVKAVACSEEGKHAMARRHGRVAIKIARAVFGTESAQFGMVINNVGELLINAGRMAEAEKLLVQGIGLLNKALADGNVDKVWAVSARSDALGNYRRLLEASGRYDEAGGLVE
jgi:tetratricopeptide (TPR) repeat protein